MFADLFRKFLGVFSSLFLSIRSEWQVWGDSVCKTTRQTLVKIQLFHFLRRLISSPSILISSFKCPLLLFLFQISSNMSPILNRKGCAIETIKNTWHALGHTGACWAFAGWRAVSLWWGFQLLLHKLTSQLALTTGKVIRAGCIITSDIKMEFSHCKRLKTPSLHLKTSLNSST